MLNKITQGDTIEEMRKLAGKSVDMILCDLPYGTTSCKWDTVIPFEPLWAEYERVIKDNGAIVLTSDEPFTSQLINSNIRKFRYKWIWDKTRGSNFQNAKRMPMKSHEEVLVFYKKQPTYNPQYWYSTPYSTSEGKRKKVTEGLGESSPAGNHRSATLNEDGRRYPLTILKFPRDSRRIHPTQKPVALFEYLIKTYSNEGDIILDNCIGSGTTAVAAINTGRNFIGIERETEYCEIARQRITDALKTEVDGL